MRRLLFRLAADVLDQAAYRAGRAACALGNCNYTCRGRKDHMTSTTREYSALFDRGAYKKFSVSRELEHNQTNPVSDAIYGLGGVVDQMVATEFNAHTALDRLMNPKIPEPQPVAIHPYWFDVLTSMDEAETIEQKWGLTHVDRHPDHMVLIAAETFCVTCKATPTNDPEWYDFMRGYEWKWQAQDSASLFEGKYDE